MQPVMRSSVLVCALRRWASVSGPVLQALSRAVGSPNSPDHHDRSFSVSSSSCSGAKTLDPAVFYDAARSTGVHFFCGVPDSLLKDFCAYVTNNTALKDHMITANEGCAVAMASGYHLATGATAMVYLQNSGLGNMVNPLMSLSNPAVYSIPMLLLIGWRGEPGVKDEPQHIAQGKITPDMLRCMDIPCEILPREEEGMREVLKHAQDHFEDKKSPFAILVRSKTFSPYVLPLNGDEKFPLTREDALMKVVDCLIEEDAVVGTTGMLSRELFEYRVALKMGHARDFLTVGSMGHASSIALAIALQKPNRQVFCLDGDGAILMHMGALASVGQRGPENLKHIVFNNGAHDSVGGQPTEAGNHDTFDLCAIAKGCGYRETLVASSEKEIEDAISYLHKAKGPVFLELKVKLGSRSNLGRPTRTTHENKDDFMSFLKF